MIRIKPSTFIFSLLFLCFSFLSIAHAKNLQKSIPTQLMNSDTVKLEHFEMGYFVDQNEDMPFDKVQHQNFTLTPNALSLGTAAKATWSKIELKKYK